MLELDGLLGLIAVGLWVFCFIDVVLTPDGQQRNLPKLAWVFIVLLFFDIGAIAWLAFGKNYDKRAARRQGEAANQFPEYDRPGRYVPSNPDDDAAFLAGLRERAEEQRRRAREQSPDQPDGKADPSTPEA